jgi:hypothetical protein
MLDRERLRKHGDKPDRREHDVQAHQDVSHTADEAQWMRRCHAAAISDASTGRPEIRTREMR